MGRKKLEELENLEKEVDLERVKELLVALKEKYGLNSKILKKILEERSSSKVDRELEDLEETGDLERVRKLLEALKEKYGVSSEDLTEVMEEEFSFPNVILNKRLTVLESVVKYLREDRDRRNVWNIYDKAKKKFSRRFVIGGVKYWIPVSILSSELSALEAIVKYLKEECEVSYSEIGRLLERDPRTIWTVYARARKKRTLFKKAFTENKLHPSKLHPSKTVHPSKSSKKKMSDRKKNGE
jgi:ribosomal protein S13